MLRSRAWTAWLRRSSIYIGSWSGASRSAWEMLGQTGRSERQKSKNMENKRTTDISDIRLFPPHFQSISKSTFPSSIIKNLWHGMPWVAAVGSLDCWGRSWMVLGYPRTVQRCCPSSPERLAGLGRGCAVDVRSPKFTTLYTEWVSRVLSALYQIITYYHYSLI